MYTSYTYIQELKDYIRKREAQIQPLMGELNLLKDLKKEQIAALEKLQTENYRLNEALEALRRRPRSVVHTHTHTHTHTHNVCTHTHTHTHTHTQERPAEVVRGGETPESLRQLLVQANEAMQNMEDEQKRVLSEFERSKFHEQVSLLRNNTSCYGTMLMFTE